MRKPLIIIAAVLISAIILASIGYAYSNNLEIEHINISSHKSVCLSAIHISDLHYPHHSIALDEIIAAITSEKPDFILLTGDILDGSADNADVNALLPFFNKLSAIAKCFCVIGNHEIGSDYLDEYISTATQGGITLLLNETVTVRHNGNDISFVGISDAYSYNDKIKGYNQLLDSNYKILLAHRPELFNEYCAVDVDAKPDLIFSGHAHGGGLRFGSFALYAPNQGLFPSYTSGLYEKNGSYMVVSRGLGVSGIDFRFFNKYHLPLVKINS